MNKSLYPVRAQKWHVRSRLRLSVRRKHLRFKGMLLMQDAVRRRWCAHKSSSCETQMHIYPIISPVPRHNADILNATFRREKKRRTHQRLCALLSFQTGLCAIHPYPHAQGGGGDGLVRVGDTHGGRRDRKRVCMCCSKRAAFHRHLETLHHGNIDLYRSCS